MGRIVTQLHHTYWSKFRLELLNLNKLEIPRHLFTTNDHPTCIQLHGFADASEKAFGAAIYIRSKYSTGSLSIHLYCSKSRVAPLRTATLARLEICAAVLLAELMHHVLQHLNFPINRAFYWSDSTIALHWIKGDPYSWNTFVGNRVASIQELCDPKDWFHVVSKSNPADVVSRGLMPDKLINCKMWFNGPNFLYSDDEKWLQDSSKLDCSEEIPERRAVPISMLVKSIPDAICPIAQMKFVNDYQRMVKTMAYVARFLSNVKLCKQDRIKTPIGCNDLTDGINLIVKFIQRHHFSDVFADLNSKGSTKIKHLKQLALFVDKEGLIRVGGRLQFAAISYSSKHPMLFPPNHPFTLTLFSYLHRKHLHVGPKTLLAISRELVWTVNGITVAKRVCAMCIQCAIARPRSITQQMGALPKERVQVSAPFSNVSVDFCGPFFAHYKIRGRVPTKTYIAVFVCHATKAVHLEVASDMSAACFLGTFKRFVGTRGLPVKVFSDNGTNFVGANSDLHDLYVLLQSSNLADDLKQMCHDDKITWHFYPPGSPHFGGLHEAAVKAAKYHMRRVIGKANLTLEELNTLIKQVEAVLNSRPLTAICSSTDDLLAITPGHFLIGRALITIPEPILDADLNHTKRWELVQNLHQHFWKAWSRDYLTELQKRHKWQTKSPNIRIGEIVLLKDDNLPSLKWKMGRVIDLHPGVDGLIRVVTVQCGPKQIYKRAITRICPLPVEIEQDDVQGGENV